MTKFEIREIKSKTILNPPSYKNADYDFTLDPYVGCRFGCTYCYAGFMAKVAGKKIRDWGNFVFPVVNAPALLKTRIAKLPNRGKGKNIWIGSLSDPYQGLEAKYRLTRQCLKAFVDMGFKGKVSILTKSGLILRDTDLIKRLYNAEVGISITSNDDLFSRCFEINAPPSSARLKALKKLTRTGIKTYAFVGPLFPYYLAEKSRLISLLKTVKKTGVETMDYEYLNYSDYIKDRLGAGLKNADTKFWNKGLAVQKHDYRQSDKIILGLSRHLGFKMRKERLCFMPGC